MLIFQIEVLLVNRKKFIEFCFEGYYKAVVVLYLAHCRLITYNRGDCRSVWKLTNRVSSNYKIQEFE